MKAGIPVASAAGIEGAVLFLAAILLIAWSRFPVPVRLGLLFGTFLGAIAWNELYTIRPDLLVVLAWIGGLIGLESGRLAGWSWWRLAAGSILLCYAGALHYTATFAVSGLGVYFVWAWLGTPWKNALRRIAPLAAGPLFVTLPYLLLFVIPMKAQIVEIVKDVQGGGGLSAAWRNHFLSYDVWLRMSSINAGYQPVVQTLLAPAWWSHIPLALIGPSILFAIPSTRGLALAALPQVLFVLLGARHKQIGYSGYWAPETVLYLCAVLAAIFLAVWHLAGRLQNRKTAIACLLAFTAVSTGMALHDRPGIGAYERRWTMSPDEFDAARAAARAMIGNNALVGTTGAGTWYMSGARYHYGLYKELFYPESIAGLDVRKLLAPFDAAVIDTNQGWMTYNRERRTLSSFYVEGKLALKGVWFADQRVYGSAVQSMLFLSVEPPRPAAAYGLWRGKMVRFDPGSGGDAVLLCAVCPLSELRNEGGRFPYFATFHLPGPDNSDPRAAPEAGNPRPALRTLLIARERFDREVAPALTHCQVRDKVEGRMTEIDRASMVGELRKADRPIQFYRDLETAWAHSGRINENNTARLPGALRLDPVWTGTPGASVERAGNSFRVVTPPEPELQAAWNSVLIPEGTGAGFLYVRATVPKGKVVIRLCRDINCTEPVVQMVREQGESRRDMYFPVKSFAGINRLSITNARAGEESEIVLEDAAIAVPR
jgi:hypothetical protein